MALIDIVGGQGALEAHQKLENGDVD